MPRSVLQTDRTWNCTNRLTVWRLHPHTRDGQLQAGIRGRGEGCSPTSTGHTAAAAAAAAEKHDRRCLFRYVADGNQVVGRHLAEQSIYQGQCSGLLVD